MSANVPSFFAVDKVAFGKYDNMVAEVGSLDYLAYLRRIGESYDARNYRYAVMVVGKKQYDTEFFRTIKDAKAVAAQMANHYGVNVWHV